MQHCRGGGITSELDRGRGTFLRPDVVPTATALPLVGSVAWEPFPRRSVQPVNGTEVSRMSHHLSSYLGGLAAFLASLSYVPQARKAWPRESTSDLSIGMLVALTTGLALWVVYGAMRGDWVIIAAN